MRIKKIFLQAFYFFGISGIGWILDFCTFILLGFISENLIINNTVSSWIGVTFVFCFATRTVFNNSNRLYLKYFIYLVYQILLIYGISKLLNYINLLIAEYLVGSFIPVIAKMVVTPVTMILNFIFMKNIVERI